MEPADVYLFNFSLSLLILLTSNLFHFNLYHSRILVSLLHGQIFCSMRI